VGNCVTVYLHRLKVDHANYTKVLSALLKCGKYQGAGRLTQMFLYWVLMLPSIKPHKDACQICLFTWCGYEVSGMILLRHLKGAVRLDRSKDKSVHVSTCASRDFNALTPVLWKLWH